MNKKLIEQIKNLPGVKLVEPTPHCSLIVVFEPEIDYIQCNTKEEYCFLFPLIHRATSSPKWEDLCHPVWIKMEAKTVRECTATVVEPGGKTIDASDYINPNLTEAFQEYMVDEALKRFPEGCTVHWSSSNFYHHNIKRPFVYTGEHIQDTERTLLWCKYKGWADLVKEKPKEKELEHYEKTLLDWKADGSNAFGVKYTVYCWLKNNRPEIYWLEVLKVIADDLIDAHGIDDICHIGFNSQSGEPEGISVPISNRTPGEIIFCSRDAAEKAIRIMGDKLRFLNGQPTPKG